MGIDLNCETCPVRAARADLSPGNLLALDTFDLLARRIVVDFQLAPLVFDALRLSMTAAEARVLVESLDLIYDLRCPVKKRPNV